MQYPHYVGAANADATEGNPTIMRVGIDLDGVCYDFAASVREYLSRTRSSTERYPAATRWEFYEDWGLSLEQFLRVCHAGVNAKVIFDYGDPAEGTKEAFDRLRAAGHTIHIGTDRHFGNPGVAAAATIRWLARHNLPYDSIAFTPDKSALRVDVMVDDKPENIESLLASGVAPWVLDQPWNRDVNLLVPRVASLGEFVDAIDAACADVWPVGA